MKIPSVAWMLRYSAKIASNQVIDKMEKEGRLAPYLPDGSKPQAYENSKGTATKADKVTSNG
jgi:hypothetical protein